VSSTRARTLAASEAKVGEFCSLRPALDVPKLNVKASTFKTCKKVCFFVESRSKDVKDCLQTGEKRMLLFGNKAAALAPRAQ